MQMQKPFIKHIFDQQNSNIAWKTEMDKYTGYN